MRSKRICKFALKNRFEIYFIFVFVVKYFLQEDALNVYELDEHDDVVKRWPFDHVFGPLCTNSFIYSAVGRPIVESALDGYNTVMFMYGQTSSGTLFLIYILNSFFVGKTFTLFGGNNEIGIVDHAMQEAFDIVTKSTNTEYVIKIIFVELYNEEIKVAYKSTKSKYVIF
jgi:hypothetical protein